MKGISITPLTRSKESAPASLPEETEKFSDIPRDTSVQTFTVGSMAAPFAAAQAMNAIDTSGVKGKVASWGERFKARFERAVKAFHDRISYENEVTRLSLLPVSQTLRRSVTRALLMDVNGCTTLRLTGGQQEISLAPDGQLTLCEESLPSWQIATTGDRFTVRLSAEGLEIQQGNSIRRFISNDWVAIGQGRFLLKILGSSQGAEHVHY